MKLGLIGYGAWGKCPGARDETDHRADRDRGCCVDGPGWCQCAAPQGSTFQPICHTEGAEALLLRLPSATAALQLPITYTLDRTFDQGTVTGFIRTDGNLGTLSASNILDWSITIKSDLLTHGGPVSVVGRPASQPEIRGDATSADSFHLYFDFGAGPNAFFVLQGLPPGVDVNWNYWCLQTSGCTATVANECYGYGAFGGFGGINAQVVQRSGVVAFATVAAVPEPETFAMLLAGLGLVGAIVRRRATTQRAFLQICRFKLGGNSQLLPMAAFRGRLAAPFISRPAVCGAPMSRR